MADKNHHNTQTDLTGSWGAISPVISVQQTQFEFFHNAMPNKTQFWSLLGLMVFRNQPWSGEGDKNEYRDSRVITFDLLI